MGTVNGRDADVFNFALLLARHQRRSLRWQRPGVAYIVAIGTVCVRRKLDGLDQGVGIGAVDPHFHLKRRLLVHRQGGLLSLRPTALCSTMVPSTLRVGFHVHEQILRN